MENGYNPIISQPSDADVLQAYRDGYAQGQKDARCPLLGKCMNGNPWVALVALILLATILAVACI